MGRKKGRTKKTQTFSLDAMLLNDINRLSIAKSSTLSSIVDSALVDYVAKNKVLFSQFVFIDGFAELLNGKTGTMTIVTDTLVLSLSFADNLYRLVLSGTLSASNNYSLDDYDLLIKDLVKLASSLSPTDTTIQYYLSKYFER